MPIQGKKIPVFYLDPKEKSLQLIIGDFSLNITDMVMSKDNVYFGTLNESAQLQIIKAFINNLE